MTTHDSERCDDHAGVAGPVVCLELIRHLICGLEIHYLSPQRVTVDVER